MIAKITVTLKAGLLDAQGKTVKGALEALGFKGVGEVRIGKYVEIDLQGVATAAARAAVDRMCQQVLTNPVIETYHLEMDEDGKPHTRRRKPAKPARRPAARRKARVRR